jgi:hypothetical protein
LTTGAAGTPDAAALFWSRFPTVGAGVVPGWRVTRVVKPLSSYVVTTAGLESPGEPEGEATGDGVKEAAWDICKEG